MLQAGNITEIIGGDYSGSNLKCHILLTAIITGKISQTGDLIADGYVYRKDIDYEKFDATHYRYCKGTFLFEQVPDILEQYPIFPIGFVVKFRIDIFYSIK